MATLATLLIVGLVLVGLNALTSRPRQPEVEYIRVVRIPERRSGGLSGWFIMMLLVVLVFVVLSNT